MAEYLPTGEKPKLLDQVRAKLRLLHYAWPTEKSYVNWIVRYLRFHRDAYGGVWVHPLKMGKPEIEEFLSDLAVKHNVARSTQNQAFSALLFLYRKVLNVELPMIEALRAAERRRIPVVLSRTEVRALLGAIEPARKPWMRNRLSAWRSRAAAAWCPPAGSTNGRSSTLGPNRRITST